MSNKFSTALYTFVLYGLTLALGIIAAFRHVIMPQLGSVTPLEPTIGNALMFILVFAVFTAIMVRFARAAAVSLSFLLAVALVAGSQFIFAGWLSLGTSIIAAIGVLLILRLVPIVLIHDLAIVLGIAGISGLMGLSVNPLTAAVLLAALSIYDIISVYRTRHMVALAGRMLSSGAVFGFLVPARFGGFFMSTRKALDAREVMMLGSGDIGLPLVLAASAVSQSIGAAVMVAGFSLVGVLVMNWLFTHQKEPAPMAALPPIAAAAILGYVAALLLKL